MRNRRRTVALAATLTIAFLAAGPAFSKCADEIKALQGSAADRDAAVKPGEQARTNTGSNPSEGGGKTSASAKVMEAQAHDQRGDEAACMRALDEAKAMTRP